MVEIREITVDDLEALVGLLQQLWPERSIDKGAVGRILVAGLRSDNQAYIGAVEECELIGFCSLTVKNNLWLEAKSGIVDELVVDGAHRGRGVGRRLMGEIEKIAREQGCKRLDLESAGNLTSAHEFYERLGFEKTEYSSFFFAKNVG
ncbi:MAG: GNAT family N-acetyltransferase [Alistipes sp.]|jgi:ribosomal protein S18 acetylase RimI-like enzyme|nr:GNAT family N-acetyltransferase [Alistipes sp.]